MARSPLPSPAAKPAPVPEPEDLPFWEGLQMGALVLRSCDTCGALRQRAEMLCSDCQGETFSWITVSGRGRIYSFAIAHDTWVQGFEGELPYVIVAVSIEEWPRLLITTNLVGDFDPSDLELDLPVRAVFEPRGEWSLLQFEIER
jgi:uncharacterized protein